MAPASEPGREAEWKRDFARGMREFDRVATRELRPMLDFVRGRWSKARPSRDGVYCVRRVRDGEPHSWVTHFDPAPHSTFTGTDQLEFFHLAGDVDGAPTRWDDERVAREAHANGWRERNTHGDRPPSS